jgi:hypothetical protein
LVGFFVKARFKEIGVKSEGRCEVFLFEKISTNKPKLSSEQWEIIFQDIKKYYNFEQRVYPESSVETDVKCPVCGNNLILTQLDVSCSIVCKTENCLNKSLRGI